MTLGRMATAALLAALATAGSAGEQRVGAWSVGMTKERAGAFASTVNERSWELGQYCYPELGTCVWVLSTSVACDAGDRHPLVVNSDSGAAVLETLCLGIRGKAAYAFADFDAIDAIVRRASTVVLALPTANGRFQLSRFSLNGATRAVALMRRAAEAMGGRPDTDRDGGASDRVSF